MTRNQVLTILLVVVAAFVGTGYYLQKYYQEERTKVVLLEIEEIKKMAEKALSLAEQAKEKAIEEHTKKEIEDAKRLAKEAAFIARTVKCPKCNQRFEPEKNKAPLYNAIIIGAGAGATAGSTAGAFAGAGTGVAVGGVGAFPGTVMGGVIGALGGGVTGGIGAAWYRDRRVMCPSCGEVFKNPKN